MATLVAGLVFCCGGLFVCWGYSTLFGFLDDETGGLPPEPPIVWATGDRHSQLAAPGGPRRYEMRFADGSTGYVLFGSCRQSCPAALYGTTDGGRTWQRLPLDLDGAEYASLVVGDPRKVAVGMKGAYHVSRDGGQTFVVEPDYPSDLGPSVRAKAWLDCVASDDDGCRRYGVARGETLVPVQPPLPADRDEVDEVTEDATGRIWTVTTVRNAIYTTVSSDGGASWRSLPDLDYDFRPGPVRLAAAPDDREPWLVIGHDEPGRLSAYRGRSDRWRSVVEGGPVDIEWDDVVSAGGGAVGVFGDRVRHLSDDGTWHTAPPTDVLAMRRLADGSLAAHTRNLQGVWLGTRTGTDFAWALVTVEPV